MVAVLHSMEKATTEVGGEPDNVANDKLEDYEPHLSNN